MQRTFFHDAREVLVEALRGAARHRIDTHAAALAYNVLLALAPLLILALAMVGLILHHGDARAEVLSVVRVGLGAPGAATVADWLDAAQASSVQATAIGLVLFFLGGTRLVAQVVTGLEVVHDAPYQADTTFRQDLHTWIKNRARGALITLGLGLWMALSLAGTQAVGAIWPSWASGILRIVRDLLGLGSLCTAMLLIYRLGPKEKLPWRDVITGAVASAVLLWLGTWLLTLWFHYAHFGASYGAAGSVIAVLIWLFFASISFLFGAEIGVAVSRRRWAWRLRRKRRASGPRDLAGQPVQSPGGTRIQ